MENAGFWHRALAFAIDVALLAALRTGVYVTLSAKVSPSPGLLNGHLSYGADTTAISIVAIYCVVFWIWLGATPGKIVTGLKVVDRDLEKISVARAVGRFLLLFVSVIPFGLPLIWVAIDPDKRGLHDRLAGTQVVTRW